MLRAADTASRRCRHCLYEKFGSAERKGGRGAAYLPGGRCGRQRRKRKEWAQGRRRAGRENPPPGHCNSHLRSKAKEPYFAPINRPKWLLSPSIRPPLDPALCKALPAGRSKTWLGCLPARRGVFLAFPYIAVPTSLAVGTRLSTGEALRTKAVLGWPRFGEGPRLRLARDSRPFPGTPSRRYGQSLLKS